ncbi:MAG TPA: hypothetical protein VK781_10530 [Solirubrobacteraceae bacterium]|jgi:hypothetical protein|nr:hypothetical protein [Solirubrobacteraceae bacterium]
MPEQLFTFVQMELPWELGPADGRYLLRRLEMPEGNEPQHVVVLSTVGAERRGLLGGRSRKRRTDPEPGRVPVTRATVVDAVPLSAESQARAWLEQLDPEREAQAAAEVLNRVLFAHRIAGAEPHIHEISPAQALIVRAGYGEGEQVADGLWSDARELSLSRRRAGRRASVLRPQERLAVLLSGRGSVLLCEELALRARLDMNAGRVTLAAIELDRAYAAALAELPDEQRGDLRERIAELEALRADVQSNARAAMPTVASAVGEAAAPTAASQAAAGDGAAGRTDTTSASHAEAPIGARDEPDAQAVRHALERLEATLRARTALGFSVR